MSRALIFLIRCYQLALRPYLGTSCRFQPGCSSYAVEAIQTHGAIRGSWLAIRRLSKCHPWHAGGEDPVPPCQHSH